MVYWLATSISILIVAVTAFVKVRGARPKTALLLFGVVGLAAAYMGRSSHDVTQSAGSIGPAQATVDSLLSVQGNLLQLISAQQTAADSLAALRDSLNLTVQALHRSRDALLKSNAQLAKAPTTTKSQSDEFSPHVNSMSSGTGLGAKLGESQKTDDGWFERVDVFQAIQAIDLRDISIHMRFDNRFDRLEITQSAPEGTFDGACPDIDSVYSAAFFDYRCDYLIQGTGLIVKTYSEFPLNIVDIRISPK